MTIKRDQSVPLLFDLKTNACNEHKVEKAFQNGTAKDTTFK